jgi:hypothetical protein
MDTVIVQKLYFSNCAQLILHSMIRHAAGRDDYCLISYFTNEANKLGRHYTSYRSAFFPLISSNMHRIKKCFKVIDLDVIYVHSLRHLLVTYDRPI